MNLLTSSLGLTCHQQRPQTNRLHGIRYRLGFRLPAFLGPIARIVQIARRGRYDVCTGGAAYAHARMCFQVRCPKNEVTSSKFNVSGCPLYHLWWNGVQGIPHTLPTFLVRDRIRWFPMSRHHSVIYLITNCYLRCQLLWPIQWFSACTRLWAD